MKLTIKKDFPFAHKGYERREYTEGEVVESDDADFIAVSIKEGWAEEEKESEQSGDSGSADSAEKKAKGGAPENKAKGGAPENKAKGGK
jgi:hypothetical protein